MDTFETYQKSLSSPADEHMQLAVDAGNDIDPRPRSVYCQEAGTITLTDSNGNALPYTLTAGQYIPFRGVRVTAISGGVFYGWL